MAIFSEVDKKAYYKKKYADIKRNYDRGIKFLEDAKAGFISLNDELTSDTDLLQSEKDAAITILTPKYQTVVDKLNA